MFAAAFLFLLAAVNPGVAAKPHAQIAVVRPESACLPADKAYAASLANHVARWLANGGVRADLVGDGAFARDLAGRRIVYLVTFQRPSATQLAALAAYRAQGGKIAVLQSYSPELAAFMGVAKPSAKPLRASPVLALPANGGWWVGNMFASGDEDEAKERFVCSLAAMSVPGSWNFAAWESRRRSRLAADRAKALAQRPRAGEIHAVWDHTGLGLYPGDWPRTMRLLRTNGVTDIFVNVAGAGFAHYPSRILPQSDAMRVHGDQFEACIAAAQGCGVRVHAWVMCFNATRGTPAHLAKLAKKGWRLKDAAGRPTVYLDPSNADVRWQMLLAIGEIAAKYPVAGVHLDFVRWYENAAGKPRNAARVVETFVQAARRKVRAVRPKALLSAAVLATYPSCVTSVGQDWEAWIAKGLVDYAVPMNYTADSAKYARLMARQGASPAIARRVVGGIGVTANESALTPGQVIDQINGARRAGLAGVALFDLDKTLAVRILPLLRLGLWK
jgi:uncharacterized lipoprotein YddW (UPF0748 family)